MVDQKLNIIVKDKELFISEVSFYYWKNKDGTLWTNRMVWMRYIDYGKVTWYSMSLEALKKDINFAKKTEEEIKVELLGRYIKQTVTLL